MAGEAELPYLSSVILQTQPPGSEYVGEHELYVFARSQPQQQAGVILRVGGFQHPGAHLQGCDTPVGATATA